MSDGPQMLSARDVEALLAGDLRNLVKAEQLRSLLEKVAASMRSGEEELRRLHNDVSRIAATRKQESAPLAAAVTALRALSADEQAQVLDAWAMGLIEALHEEQAAARQHTLAAVSAMSRAELAIARIVEHPDTPEHVRLAGHAALESMPDLRIVQDSSVMLERAGATGFTLASAEAEEGLAGEELTLGEIEADLGDLFATDDSAGESLALTAARESGKRDWSASVDELFASPTTSTSPNAEVTSAEEAETEADSEKSGQAPLTVEYSDGATPVGEVVEEGWQKPATREDADEGGVADRGAPEEEIELSKTVEQSPEVSQETWSEEGAGADVEEAGSSPRAVERPRESMEELRARLEAARMRLEQGL